MTRPPAPPGEYERLAALRSYAVLDTPPEAVFDDLTQLAAHICQAPIALITLIDEHRQWLKSAVGFNPQEVPRAITFCTHAILQPEVFVVSDATRDPRFSENPFVTGEPHIRFYAGCPLLTPNGEALGTLCVIDSEARNLHPDHERALRVLSRHVMALLEERRSRLELKSTRQQLDVETALRQGADHFRHLAEQIDQVFWIADPAQDRVLYVNAAFERIWGRPREELYSDPRAMLDAIHPEDRARVRAALPLQKEGKFREEYRIVCPDGVERWISERAFPVRDDAGKVLQIAGVAEDITERRQSREDADMERRLSEQTINSLPGVFYVFDAEGRFLRWNSNFESVTGYSAEEFRHLHPLDLFRGAGREQIAERITQVFESGSSEAEAELVAKDGRSYPFYFSGRRVDVDGRPCLVGMGVDISALKRAEAERDRIFNLSPDLYCVVGIDGYFKQLNPAWERVLGYSRTELLARPYVDFVHPEDRPRTLGEAARVAGANAHPVEFENRYICRDGSFCWLSWHSVSVPEEGLIYGAARDVTIQKEVSRALQESEERYRSVVESARDGIFTLAPDGSITSLNAAFEVATGWSRKEWVGRQFRDILHPEDAPKAMRLFDCVLRGEAVPAFELRVAAKETGHIPTEFSATAQQLNGRAVGVLGIARDLRERHRMEEQLRQVEKLDSIGRLAAGIAHDFNNLLTVQQGHISLLCTEQELPDKMGVHLKEIAGAADRAAELTQQLLLFSRRRPMHRRRIDLNEAVVSLARMLDRVVGEDIALNLDCDDHLPCIDGDAGMMEQVLMNLVMNARDAMPAGGRIELATRSVSLTERDAQSHPMARPGQFVCLAVTDTGSGIPQEVLENIFEPFFTTKDIGKGTGLGLATAHGIVRQHEGWIEVESRPGAGTKFSIFLPAVDAAEEPIARPAASLGPRGGTETILAVEDEESLRKLLRTVLERSGYQVLLASDGVEALELWRERSASVDLLLTDMVMPRGISGQELATKLLAERPDLKVLIMSGYAPQGRDMDNGPGHRRFNFLQKPYRPRDLTAAVRACLDGASGASGAAGQTPDS
jgi:PAS domain S-box-containing protein